MIVMTSITSPTYEESEEGNEEERSPVDIVIVIDKSGSMRGQKLDLCKKTCEFVVSQLNKKDRISIVSYDTHVHVDLALLNVTSENKDKVICSINNIRSGSCTNLSGGLLKGLEQFDVSKLGTKNEVSSVLLFTDGLANEGIQDSKGIVAAEKKALEKIGGVSVFTLGYGSDHDEDMLRSIAEAGKGMYYFVSNPDEIPQHVLEILGGLLSVVCQNMNLKITLQNDCKEVSFMSELPYRNNLVSLGDMYSEETRDLLWEIEVPDTTAFSDGFPCASFELSFFNVMTGSQETLTARCDIVRTEDSKLFERGPSHQRIDSHRNRVRAAAAMENASKLADHGDLEQARKMLMNAVDEVAASDSKADVMCQQVVTDMQEALGDMESKARYRMEGSKKMKSAARAHAVQRSAGQKVSVYETSAKKKMKRKW